MMQTNSPAFAGLLVFQPVKIHQYYSANRHTKIMKVEID